MPMPKSTVNFRPGSPLAALMPSVCWNSSTRKPSKPGILQRKAILRLIHAEAARPAGTRGEEDVIVDDLLARQALLLQPLQIRTRLPTVKYVGLH